MRGTITEGFGKKGAIAYDYSSYGTVTKTGNLVQPVQWFSEMNDEELALFYYNYRYYNPADGRWINRDLYSMLENNAITFYNEKEMAVPAIACGGIVVGTYTYTAAKMMGLSVCVCLVTTA